jgi:hypothetical protein
MAVGRALRREPGEEVLEIAATSGSAFSWISSEAEVWRQKRVRRPVCIPCSPTQRATSRVISCRPAPGVLTVRM